MGATLNLDRLRAIISDLDDAITEGELAAAQQIADLASQLAPHDPTNTGKHLNESIEARQNADGSVSVVAGVGLDDIRADVQEYGSIYQSPQPYLTPAAAQIDVEQEIAAAIRRRLA